MGQPRHVFGHSSSSSSSQGACVCRGSAIQAAPPKRVPKRHGQGIALGCKRRKKKVCFAVLSRPKEQWFTKCRDTQRRRRGGGKANGSRIRFCLIVVFSSFCRSQWPPSLSVFVSLIRCTPSCPSSFFRGRAGSVCVYVKLIMMMTRKV